MDPQDDEAEALCALLRLLEVEPGSAPDEFVGPRKPGGVGRVFGGQLVAQAIASASRTVPADRAIHSLHGYFMRPASEDHELDFAVESEMDGGAFSNRRVVASQLGKRLFGMTASFQTSEAGPNFQAEMPQVPPPEDLDRFGDYVRAHPDKSSPLMRRIFAAPSPFDYRPVTPLTPDMLRRPHRGEAFFWIRVGKRPLGIDQTRQRALLAWISDTLLLASAYRANGIQIGMSAFQAASIDHAMWFHGDVECGDWLLYAIHSPWTGNARGIGVGRFYARDGRLVASVAQEGLMRPGLTSGAMRKRARSKSPGRS